MIIAGYWDPNPGRGIRGPCGDSVACTLRAGTYPHIGDGQEFWIEDPPHWGWEADSEEWTLDLILANNRPMKFECLPRVLMHEFGHTTGLGHNEETDYIMGKAVQSTLTSNDINAADASYQDHTAH